MYLCIDTYYVHNTARVAAAAFCDIASPCVAGEYVLEIENQKPYRSGFFFKRELPGIMELLSDIEIHFHSIIIDGYVWLSPDQAPGLGGHLFRALQDSVPIIGVAKSPYRENTNALPVFRGGSTRPLHITAAGMRTEQAAHLVRKMHGPYRLPTIIKHVDRLSRMSLVTANTA